MKDFRDLEVWQKSHKLVLLVYNSIESFPNSERYGVSSQIRRAAVSIPTNIAEGCGRHSDPDFAHFLQMAFGSASELNYLILLAKDLGYLSAKVYNEIESLLTECMKMLSGLIKSVRSRIPKT